MKLIYLLLFSLLCNEALSQGAITIEGQVRDYATKEPIAYANIHLVGTNFGTVASRSGNFVFKYSPSGKGDIIEFSHLGYEPFQMHLQDTLKRYFTIFLEPQPFQLDGIVVKPLNPADIIYQCISKFSKNYNLNPHAVQGFQRENVRVANKYIQLLEVSFETKLGREGAQISNVLDARFIEDKKEKAPLWNSSRGGFYTFGWTSVSGIENPTAGDFLGINVKRKSDLTKYYEFELMELLAYRGRELYVIKFDQKKGIRRALLKGTIYIDPDSHAIVKMTYGLSPRGIKKLASHETFGGKKISRPPKKIGIRVERYEVNYKKYGSKWYLNSLVVDSEFDASLVFFRVVQSQKELLKFHSERVVTGIDTTASPDSNVPSNISDIGSIPTLQNFIKKNYENYDVVDEEKWANVNLIQADTSIAQIAKALSRNNQQWELTKQQQISEKVISRSNYTSRQLNEDLDYLRETLVRIHPGLYWYTDRNLLDGKFESVKSKLKRRNTENEFFHLVSSLIENIHCGHTSTMPSIAKSEYLSLYTKQFPLHVWINDDSAFVVKTKGNILKGSRVIGINGFTMPEIIDRIKQGTASDGFNQTYKEFLLNRTFPALFAKHFPTKDTFEVEIKDLNGETNTLTMAGEENAQIQNTNKSDAKLSIYDSLHTALLTIPSFFTNQDLPSFFEKAFRQIESLSIKKLIIDLRNNEGGNDAYGALFFSYLSSAPFKYYEHLKVATMDTTVLSRLYFGDLPFNEAIPHYLSNIREKEGTFFYTNHANLRLQQPNENPFKGQVYILINGGTFSAAAEFASIAHNNKRAVFIGEETGGGYYGNCSLGTPTLTLPNSKIRITIPLAKNELAVSEMNPIGHGVIPDYRTTYSLTDILRNTDKDLEFCLRMIIESRE